MANRKTLKINRTISALNMHFQARQDALVMRCHNMAQNLGGAVGDELHGFTRQLREAENGPELQAAINAIKEWANRADVERVLKLG